MEKNIQKQDDNQLVTLTIQTWNVSSEKEPFYVDDLDFSIVGSKNQSYQAIFAHQCPKYYETPALYHGGTAQFLQCWKVPANDNAFVAAYRIPVGLNNAEYVYFATE